MPQALRQAATPGAAKRRGRRLSLASTVTGRTASRSRSSKGGRSSGSGKPAGSQVRRAKRERLTEERTGALTVEEVYGERENADAGVDGSDEEEAQEDEEDEEDGVCDEVEHEREQQRRRSPRLEEQAVRERSIPAAQGEDSEEDDGSALPARPRARRGGDLDEDERTSETVLERLTTKRELTDTLVKVMEDLAKASRTYAEPLAEDVVKRYYVAAPAGEPMANPQAVHRLFMLLLSLVHAYRKRARDAPERADPEPALGIARAPPPPRSVEESRIHLALDNLRRGYYTKTTRALGSKGLADITDQDVRAALDKLYPRAEPCDTGVLLASAEHQAICTPGFSEDDVLAFLKTRRRGIAGGASGITYDLLKEACSTNSGGARAIAGVCSLLASGRLNVSNPNTVSVLLHLNGVALAKDAANKTKVRPIGLTETLVNMTGSLLVHRDRMGENTIATAAGPNQFGFGVRCGTQVAGLKVAIALASDPNAVVNTFDGSNYFNSVRRTALQDALSKLPVVAPFYTPQLLPNSITYNNRRDATASLTIEIQAGATQGGSVSGPLCNAADGPVTVSALSKHPNVSHAGYYDDKANVGKALEALEAANALEAKLKSDLGVTVAHKEVYAAKGLDEAARAAYVNAGYQICDGGLIFAGNPLGSREFVDKWVASKADAAIELLRDAEAMLRASGNKDDLQAVFRWVRLSVLPSLNHVLRLVDPAITVPHAERFDQEVVALALRLCKGTAAYESLAEGDRANVRELIHLPVSMGGLGLAKQARVAHVAYVGGIAATLARVVGPTSAGGLGLAAPDEGAETPAFLLPYEDACKFLGATYDGFDAKDFEYRKLWLKDMPQAQSKLYAITVAHAKRQVEAHLAKLDYSSAEGRYRRDAFTASTAAEAGAWLTASPLGWDTKMTDVTFEHALLERLCVPRLAIQPGAKCLACGKPEDIYGNHVHGCREFQRFRTARAAEHQKLLRDVARKAGFSVYSGEPAVSIFFDARPGGRQDVESKQRFDVVITSTRQNGSGTADAIDLKFTATTKVSDKKTYSAAGDSANRAEMGKVQYYARSYVPCKDGPKVRVRGFAQETGGPLGTYAKELLRACAESTPSYGLPGQGSAGARYRSIVERFAVLNQTNNAVASRHYLRQRALAARAPAAPAADAAPAAQAEAQGAE